MSDGTDTLAADSVDALNAVSGSQEGRAAHAKGILLSGTFEAAPQAARLTRAPHMQGEPVPATVRFSNGGGDPSTPDYALDARGMSTKFYLPDGARTDIVALTLPVFFVRTPEDCLEFARARTPNPETGQPDPERLGSFLAAHPEAQPAIQAAVSAAPPRSYAESAYHALHAFRWVDAEGGSRYVRYRWLPEAGITTITHEEARERGADYLRDEILERIQREPISFALELQIAAEGDPVDDPTAVWPEDRERVIAGRLELTAQERDREREGDVLVFDPTRVCDGIECSNDPVLLFRPDAYAVSVERRSGATR